MHSGTRFRHTNKKMADPEPAYGLKELLQHHALDQSHWGDLLIKASTGDYQIAKSDRFDAYMRRGFSVTMAQMKRRSFLLDSEIDPIWFHLTTGFYKAICLNQLQKAAKNLIMIEQRVMEVHPPVVSNHSVIERAIGPIS